jgi:hypothetical protein
VNHGKDKTDNMLSTESLLRKAVLDTSSFDGAGEAPLSVEQVKQFIELMSAEQVMLADARRVTSSSAKWQESIVDFASRIARPGTQATRLADGDRVVPDVGLVEINTELLRGEVPITDEVMEDNVASQGFAASLERLIAGRFGFDIEELLMNGDTNSGDTYLALLNGWLEQATDGKSGPGQTANTFDASSYGQDYQEVFKQMLTRFPKRFLRSINGGKGRYYVPVTLDQKYRDLLATRGTALGDFMLTEAGDLKYQGIKITPVPVMDEGIVSGTPDTSEILLTNPSNLYAGFHRAMRFETWRDPREGVTSFVITARVDAEIAVVNATAHANLVNIEP